MCVQLACSGYVSLWLLFWGTSLRQRSQSGDKLLKGGRTLLALILYAGCLVCRLLASAVFLSDP